MAGIPETQEEMSYQFETFLRDTRGEPGLPLYRIAQVIQRVLTPEEILALVDNIQSYAQEE